MQFDEVVEIPLPLNEAWKLLLDVPQIAPCLPGAELIAIENDTTYKGKVSVRLGPVSLTFSGLANIEAIDEVNHCARIKAQGIDSKGRGGANAVIGFQLHPSASGTTVSVHTDLALSGAVAQYGRASGLIREVAAQLMIQFADALKAKLTSEDKSKESAAETDAPTPTQHAKPISGMSLLARSLWNASRRAVRGASS